MQKERGEREREREREWRDEIEIERGAFWSIHKEKMEKNSVRGWEDNFSNLRGGHCNC